MWDEQLTIDQFLNWDLTACSKSINNTAQRHSQPIAAVSEMRAVPNLVSFGQCLSDISDLDCHGLDIDYGVDAPVLYIYLEAFALYISEYKVGHTSTSPKNSSQASVLSLKKSGGKGRIQKQV